MPIIAQYVKLLKASKLTQKVLAKELGVTARTYSKWTNGHAVPSSERTKGALERAFIKYGVVRTPTVFTAAGTPVAIPVAAIKEAQVPTVPDFDPARLRRARKASGLTALAFSETLGITNVSQYYLYEKGKIPRKRSIRQSLYLVCQTVPEITVSNTAQISVPAVEGETEPQARSRGRSIVSEDLIRDSVERFEREELADFEREIVTKALCRTAQEYGYVPRQLREAIVIVFARVRGHVPISSLFTLLSGIDP